ncbi:MAG TPA: hypothetical protein VK762_14800 [Polyangiaceae bacterium]|nr:hypothetical protein [Polyangiaceae bacterium]
MAAPAWLPAPRAFSFFGRSATTHSVVSIRLATLAAFCSAVGATVACSAASQFDARA